MQAPNLDNSGFKAYITFLAIKQHFTSNYDYFKYNGKVKANPSVFKGRSDYFKFVKLEKKHKTDLDAFFVSNALEDNLSWIGNLDSPEAEETYNAWKGRIQSLQYHFKEQMKTLRDNMEETGASFDDLFIVHLNEHPPIFKYLQRGSISLESFVIMNKLLHFSNQFDKKMVDDSIWMRYSKKVMKYSPFIVIDTQKYKKILRDVFL
jgi:hypothetical protein